MTQTMEGCTTESLALPVLGMTCAACQHHVEKALQQTVGVKSAHVDLMANRASVVFDPALTHPEDLVEAIRKAGYDAVIPRSGETSYTTEAKIISERCRSQSLGNLGCRRSGNVAGHAAWHGNGRSGSSAHALSALALSDTS